MHACVETGKQLMPAKTRLLGSVSIPVEELVEAQETYNHKLAMGLMPLPTKLRSWYTLTNASGACGDVYLLIRLDGSELERRKRQSVDHQQGSGDSAAAASAAAAAATAVAAEGAEGAGDGERRDAEAEVDRERAGAAEAEGVAEAHAAEAEAEVGMEAGMSEHHMRLARLSQARELKERISKTSQEMMHAKAEALDKRQPVSVPPTCVWSLTCLGVKPPRLPFTGVHWGFFSPNALPQAAY
jgi:hypothetical protein